MTVWLDEGGGVDTRCAECYGTTLLMAAAYGGREAVVRMLLQRGASINLQNSIGWTPLIAAATGGHTTIVQTLLDAKADASLQTENDSTALMLAENKKHTATAQLLRQHAEQMTAEAKARAAASIVPAAAAAEAAGAELLEEVEAEKEAAAKKGKGKGKKKKATAKAGLPEAVYVAAMKGDAQAVAAWLDEGGGVDAGCAEYDGMTVLRAAAFGGHEALVRMLLQRGASVNLHGPLGATALMYAAGNGHTTIVQALFDAKADASLQTDARRRRAVQEVPDLRPALRRAAGGGARHARARGAHLRAAQVVSSPWDDGCRVARAWCSGRFGLAVAGCALSGGEGWRGESGYKA